MSDTAAAPADTNPNVKIPAAVKENFPELIPQILASPSMDDEERNYWFSVLPIMSPDQVGELRDILASEQKNRAKKGKAEDVKIDVKAVEAQRAEKRQERKAQESQVASAEKQEAEDLLTELEEL